MLEVLGIALFALLIGFSIALHELGHLVPAKRFGVRVTEYMIGFGPTVWSRAKGETTYGLKALPLGGYIRMIGMLPPGREDPQGTARSMTTGRFGALIADARRESLEEIQPGDENRVFYRLPVHKRLIIMVGGPFMNLVLAVFLLAILLLGIGLPQPSLKVAEVIPCTTVVGLASSDGSSSTECSPGSAPGPAAAAGVRAGDTITAVDGNPVSSWNDLLAVIAGNPGQTVAVSFDRGGRTRTVDVTVASIPALVPPGAASEAGSRERGFIGVRPEFEYVPQPWTAVPAFMWDITTASVQALVSLPIRMYELVTQTLLGDQERDIDGPVSVVGISRIGGEVAAMQAPVESKAVTFLGLAASLNLFLFLFNLLPILPLDGGHAAAASYEGVRRWWAKMRHRPDPGPVDTARMLPVAYVAATVLITMAVIVIWADIVKPITLG